MGDLLALYDYDLPPGAIASHPPEGRDGGRLLVVEGESRVDAAVPDLLNWLAPGDLVVFNDVKVHRARLRATRQTGGAVEVLLTCAMGAQWEALVRPGRRLAVGEALRCGQGRFSSTNGTRTVGGRCASTPMLTRSRRRPARSPPPYLRRAPGTGGLERYQTVFANGALRAAAAPTAGLHFTPEMLGKMDSLGVERAVVTLEVGMGTFRPLTPEMIASGRLHPERFVVPEPAWAAIGSARAQGRRVIAIGTTVARVLESMPGPGVGETSLFVREGYRWQGVDALFTNFHLPRSSLLMLVAAFAGRERVLAAYMHAVRAGYRFFSYGDAMFIPGRSSR